MAVGEFKRFFLSQANRLLSFKTGRKIVVFESDDWGSIRMSSKDSYDRLLLKGYNVHNCPYNRVDTLESDEDVSYLADCLSNFKGGDGKPPKFTLNLIVANPDFRRIKECNFTEYYHEDLEVTYNRYPRSSMVVETFRKGENEGLFKIQYHGMEHLNVSRWMNDLQSGKQALLDAFELDVFSPKVHPYSEHNPMEYMDALNSKSAETKDLAINRFLLGLKKFKELVGHPSESLIAPCYIWPEELEYKTLKRGVFFFQGNAIQKTPLDGDWNSTKNIFHFMGQRNKYGQVFLTRNAVFEPALYFKYDWDEELMRHVKMCFRNNLPCVISSHRLNYVAGLSKENRASTLLILSKFFNKLLKQFPETEFLSSDELGRYIVSKRREGNRIQ